MAVYRLGQMRSTLLITALLLIACGGEPPPAPGGGAIHQAPQTAFSGDICDQGLGGTYGCTPDAGTLIQCGQNSTGGWRWKDAVICSASGEICGESDAGKTTTGSGTTCWTKLADGGLQGS